MIDSLPFLVRVKFGWEAEENLLDLVVENRRLVEEHVVADEVQDDEIANEHPELSLGHWQAEQLREPQILELIKLVQYRYGIFAAVALSVMHDWIVRELFGERDG